MAMIDSDHSKREKAAKMRGESYWLKPPKQPIQEGLFQ